MLTYLEHLGIVSIFEKEISRYCEVYRDHKKNSELKEQSAAYRERQVALAREAEVYIEALRWSLNQVNKIKHEY